MSLSGLSGKAAMADPVATTRHVHKLYFKMDIFTACLLYCLLRFNPVPCWCARPAKAVEWHPMSIRAQASDFLPMESSRAADVQRFAAFDDGEPVHRRTRRQAY